VNLGTLCVPATKLLWDSWINYLTVIEQAEGLVVGVPHTLMTAANDMGSIPIPRYYFFFERKRILLG
jgi:hypothetical protein